MDLGYSLPQDEFGLVLTEGSFNELLDYCASIPAIVNSEPHYIGGAYSQLRPAGWLGELCYDGQWDRDSHFILDGVIHGFHVVDKDADISPYFCKNYRSATCESNKSKLQDLLIDEIENHKIGVCSINPICTHALGVIVKPSGSIRPITDCKRPIGASVNCHMSSTFSSFSYISCDDAIELMSPGCWMSCVDLQSAYR